MKSKQAEKQLVILVAAHKPYRMPQDACYLPVWVGAAQRGAPPAGYARDDAGVSISEKNGGYCELTALYWGWKNLPRAVEYVGLAHYRRYLGRPGAGRPFARIAPENLLLAKLQQVPVLLPRPRQYWIETGYSQYAHAHHAQDLTQTRAILTQDCPEYLPAYDAVMGRTGGHRFNLFVMRRDVLDRYCNWLFGVLARLEQVLDTSRYSENDKRVFGFVAERLLDVWLETNGVPYAELPAVHLERQHWLKKGTAFLYRKWRGETCGRRL